jgi:phosphoesterase RecJ-like protein
MCSEGNFQKTKDMEEIINIILDNNSFLLMAHNSPDGDALGSLIALEEVFKKLNKDVFVVLQNKVPNHYASIVGKKRVNKVIVPKKYYDVLIVLDCSDIDRIYEEALNCADRKIVIDHHISNYVIKNIFDIIYIDDVSSTGMILYEIIKILENKTDKNLLDSFIATCLYLTIRSDTGNYQNNSTNFESHYISSKLLEYNADITTVNQIYKNRDFSLLKLMGICFQSIYVDYNYKLLYLIVHKEDIKKAGSTYEEASNLIDYIRNINGVDTYLLFLEDNNNVKIKARSDTKDVAKVMNVFNGGGHIGAAGAVIYGNNVYNISNRVISEFKKNI